MARVGFCGLGVMGFPMAGHLASAGHDVAVYNRTASRALEWVAANGHQALPTPGEVARESDVVFLCVGNDDDVRQVMLGENGILDGAHKGLIVVDHTTTSATLARDMYESCAAHEVVFLDAPVSGGQAGAHNQTLTVMCGSVSVDEFNVAASIISAYSRSCVRLGGIGSGQLTKMVNQICIAGLVQALSEGVAFAEHAGLDSHAVIDVISQGAAQSWQMQNRGHTMVDGQFDFGFAVEWMVKDLKYVVDEARRNGSTIPVTQTVLGFYEELVQDGDARLDTSSLIRRLQKD
jgi:3-hydroxyisobutyrate dehydrogenase-like beta-hydroxyacid dehydrogenase